MSSFGLSLFFDVGDVSGFVHAGGRAITNAGVRFDLFDETVNEFLACNALSFELHW
jgi:hypothetical protein